jgi:hypothetical protein
VEYGDKLLERVRSVGFEWGRAHKRWGSTDSVPSDADPQEAIPPRASSGLVPEHLHEKCVMCDKGWARQPDHPRHPCPQCGEPAWDVEPDLAPSVGQGMEYRIAEVETNPNLVMSLGLVWTQNRANHARVRLPHRLKETYRHAVKDHGWRDGVGLVLRFEKVADKWGITVRPPTPWEVRRERTDACRRHQWAIRVYRKSYDINGAADRIHCACPADPPCEVCEMAARFAEDRRQPNSDGTRYWTEIQHAVMRDLGLMA